MELVPGSIQSTPNRIQFIPNQINGHVSNYDWDHTQLDIVHTKSIRRIWSSIRITPKSIQWTSNEYNMFWKCCEVNIKYNVCENTWSINWIIQLWSYLLLKDKYHLLLTAGQKITNPNPQQQSFSIGLIHIERFLLFFRFPSFWLSVATTFRFELLLLFLIDVAIWWGWMIVPFAWMQWSLKVKFKFLSAMTLCLIQKKSTVTALHFVLWLLLLVLWRMTEPEPKAIHISGFHVWSSNAASLKRFEKVDCLDMTTFFW